MNFFKHAHRKDLGTVSGPVHWLSIKMTIKCLSLEKNKRYKSQIRVKYKSQILKICILFSRKHL